MPIVLKTATAFVDNSNIVYTCERNTPNTVSSIPYNDSISFVLQRSLDAKNSMFSIADGLVIHSPYTVSFMHNLPQDVYLAMTSRTLVYNNRPFSVVSVNTVSEDGIQFATFDALCKHINDTDLTRTAWDVVRVHDGGFDTVAGLTTIRTVYDTIRDEPSRTMIAKLLEDMNLAETAKVIIIADRRQIGNNLLRKLDLITDTKPDFRSLYYNAAGISDILWPQSYPKEYLSLPVAYIRANHGKGLFTNTDLPVLMPIQDHDLNLVIPMHDYKFDSVATDGNAYESIEYIEIERDLSSIGVDKLLAMVVSVQQINSITISAFIGLNSDGYIKFLSRTTVDLTPLVADGISITEAVRSVIKHIQRSSWLSFYVSYVYSDNRRGYTVYISDDEYKHILQNGVELRLR